jgi:hypothetical protein
MESLSLALIAAWAGDMFPFDIHLSHRLLSNLCSKSKLGKDLNRIAVSAASQILNLSNDHNR